MGLWHMACANAGTHACPLVPQPIWGHIVTLSSLCVHFARLVNLDLRFQQEERHAVSESLLLGGETESEVLLGPDRPANPGHPLLELNPPEPKVRHSSLC